MYCMWPRFTQNRVFFGTAAKAYADYQIREQDVKSLLCVSKALVLVSGSESSPTVTPTAAVMASRSIVMVIIMQAIVALPVWRSEGSDFFICSPDKALEQNHKHLPTQSRESIILVYCMFPAIAYSNPLYNGPQRVSVRGPLVTSFKRRVNVM